MRKGNILKLVMVGTAFRDMSLFSLHAGDLGSLKGDRIKICPYSSKPGTVFFRTVSPNISLETQKYPFLPESIGMTLRTKNISEFLLRIIRYLPIKKVYVTVDKVCLGPEDAQTNWDRCALPLINLLTMLKLIKENLDIIGMDIVGDYSPIRVHGFLKNTASRLDHPWNIGAAELTGSSITAVNERTNLKILGAIIL